MTELNLFLLRFVSTGDIACCGSSGFLGRAIKAGSRRRGEPPTMVNHVGIMVDGTHMCESVWRVKYTELDPAKYDLCEIWRPVPSILPEGTNCILRQCRDYKGRRYGVLKLIAHGLDHLLGDRYIFRRLCLLDRYPICSWLVAWVYKRCLGIEFGVPPEYAQPDDIHDYISTENGAERSWRCVAAWNYGRRVYP